MRYLAKNVMLFNRRVDLTDNYGMIYVNLTEDDEHLVEEKLAQCFNLSYPQKHSGEKFYFSIYDMAYVFKWLELIGPVITFSIFSAFAFLLNLLIILIITSKRNKEEKLFETRMFSYILLNSTFNCLECFIYMLRPLNICLGINTIYCPSVRMLPFFLMLGIMQGYLSETIKTCSILTGLLFSLQRYAEATKAENKFLRSFSQVKLIRIVFAIILSSGLLSSVKITKDQINHNIKYIIYDAPNPFGLDLRNFSHFTISIVLHLAHYILNDFLLLIINLIIDIFLVVHIKRDLKKKIENKLKAMNANSMYDAKKMKEMLCKKKSVEKKANALVLSNMVIYGLCRLPELLAMIYFFIHDAVFPSQMYCLMQLFCYLLSNTIEYIYMISFLFNILILYKFNTNFKKGFKNFITQRL